MRYLVAVDGSEGADKAFRMTLGAWMKPGDELLLATCSEVVDHPGLKAYYMHIEEELNKKTREHSAGILQKYSALAQQAGVAAKCVELVGSAREKLIAAADDAKVDVLVVGRRGLNESERLLMGSTSEHVLKSAGPPAPAPPRPPAPLTPAPQAALLSWSDRPCCGVCT